LLARELGRGAEYAAFEIASEMTEDAITRIHVNFFNVLQQHPFVIRRLRRTTG